MWCPQCQSESPGEAIPGTGRLVCATCGTQVPSAQRTLRPSRNPQELLAKWAREETLDGLPRTRAAEPAATPAAPPPAAPAAALPPAAIPLRRRPREASPRPPFQRTVSRAGQWLANGGVGILGAGSGLIIFDHFGGHAGWALYGWITCLVGQSLLLLGVITLVMHGLEQTAQELNHRLDQLSEQLSHAEESATDGDSSSAAA